MDEKIEASVPLEALGIADWREELWRLARAKPAHAHDRMFAARFAG